ncbi:MAG: DUF1028 domain-containing protein [Anaerolineae bacterium]|nr:DUF1028 domain-containing protein [Anaerolineae bacterium]
MKRLFPTACKLAHTYSIVARDPATGEMGVAVQSHWFSVGSVVSWAETRVGAIATQALANVAYGPNGLELLKQGKTAPEVVAALTEADEDREVRQLAVIDAKGTVAAHTGQRCIAEAGHQLGDNFSVQANMMLNNTVWPEMAQAFERSRGHLAERMMAALEAAQAAGGDIRGQQSAALVVVKGQATGKTGEDHYIDLRVEDHPEPVQELKRVLRVFRAYEYMNAGDEALEKNDVEGALTAYRTAETMLPDNLEIKFWHAVSLANARRVAEALPIFKDIFSQDNNWAILVQRLPQAGLLKIGREHLRRIMAQRG